MTGSTRERPASRTRRGLLVVISAWLVLAGCFADIQPPAVSGGSSDLSRDTGVARDVEGDLAADGSTADGGLGGGVVILPTEPIELLPLTDFAGSLEVLYADSLSAVAPLEDATILVAAEGQLLRLDERGDTLGLWTDGPRGVREIVPLAGGEALVLGADGLSAFDGEGLGASPLNGLLDDYQVRRLQTGGSVDAPEIWFGADRGLLRWRNGVVREVMPGSLPVTRPRLAFGAPAGDRPALWAHSRGVLYSVVETEEEGLAARTEREDLAVRAMAVDQRGNLWVVDDVGDVHQRDALGTWVWYRFPQPVRTVSAHRRSAAVWFAGEGTLWFFERNLFTDVGVVLGSEFVFDGTLHVDGIGRAYLASTGPDAVSEAGLVRFASGRPLLLSGLDPGTQLLEMPASVSAFPARVDVLDEVTAELRRGGARETSLAVDVPADGSASPWVVPIDPTAHEPGVYELWVEASYTDSFDPVGAGVLFTIGEVPAPTWDDDIAPINELRCAECHSPEGNRTGHLRYTSIGWRSEIDAILDSVETGRMPLAPDPELTPDEIAVIQGWVAGGFR